MANIRILLQYEGHEAQVEVPLRTDLREMLRRVRLKRGPNPHDELVYQVSSEVRKDLEDRKLVQGLVHKLVSDLD